ncbi:MAG: LacI family DNA-binding transcriptional regulator [Acidimicrobiaceae bacterium]|nr:LacI family DNA-binding transcriptional regulator [Acidimicrobiaceae bacterium]
MTTTGAETPRSPANASIEDVARRAGVSSGTVSRALRGLPNVSETTRARVIAAATELNYTVSPSASSLASGRMSTIGVITPFVSRWFFAQAINGVEEVLHEANFDLVLYIDEDGKTFQSLPMRRKVDGVLLLTLPSDSPDVSGVRNLGVPVGSLHVDIEGFSSVLIDDVGGSSMATDHLLALGHRRIAMVTLDQHPSVPFRTGQDRSEGYLRSLKAAGIEVDPLLIVNGESTVEGGMRAGSELLSRAPRPTAIFVQSDEMAMGVLYIIRRAGLHCPEDISVVGFDDHELSNVFDLTTVAQPARAQGALLAHHVLDQVRLGSAPQTTTLKTHLVIRGTTAPPPSGI